MAIRIETPDTAPSHISATRRTVLLAAAAWLLCIVLGFQILLTHDTTGVVVDASTSKLSGQQNAAQCFSAESGEMRVVMAIHPQCPCTRNTLTELEHLVQRSRIAVRCTFLVALPNSDSLAWMDTTTTRTALLLPHAELVADLQGKQATGLGLTTSGAMLLIDEQGKVLFRGGITAGRSCVADNLGARTVAKILRHDPVRLVSTPVFGCEMDMRSEPAKSEVKQ